MNLSQSKQVWCCHVKGLGFRVEVRSEGRIGVVCNDNDLTKRTSELCVPKSGAKVWIERGMIERVICMERQSLEEGDLETIDPQESDQEKKGI